MNPKEAYELVRSAIEADPRNRPISGFYDEQCFGNWIVSFQAGGEAKAVVNDRGFVSLARGSDGSGEAIATIPSLRDADKASLLQALKL